MENNTTGFRQKLPNKLFANVHQNFLGNGEVVMQSLKEVKTYKEILPTAEVTMKPKFEMSTITQTPSFTPNGPGSSR